MALREPRIGSADLWNSKAPNRARLGGKLCSKLHGGPNVWLVHEFLNEKELNAVEGGTFRRSRVDGQAAGPTVHEDRTSSTFAVPASATESSIRRKVCDMLGCFSTQIEPLQLVRYQWDQKFDVHHDATLYNEVDDTLQPRRRGANFRRYTLFCYLNTVDLAHGGATEFPALGLRVQPSAGDAVLFRNVDDKGQFDRLMVHSGLPFTGAGQKMGMNIWVHDRDFVV